MKNNFEFKSKKLAYSSEWINGTLWVHVNGKILTAESDLNSKKVRKGAAGIAQNKVKAPMPGKITKVLVQAGQEVKKSQAVVVMEAMKMEYTLKSDLPGTIKQVLAKVGDQVSLGDTLVEIAEPEVKK